MVKTASRTYHGLTKTRVHHIWRNIIQRCTNPNNNNYPRYGGRGIEVCERWRSFDNFLADMGLPPEGLEIDRIDNDGNYEPSNCRWTTRTVNILNRPSNGNKHGFRGVVKEGNRYRMQIKKDGKAYTISGFLTPKEAHEAYKAKRIELYGEDFAFREAA